MSDRLSAYHLPILEILRHADTRTSRRLVVVATASYRLLPHIILRGPIPSEHQEKFKRCFPPGVVEIEDDAQGHPQAIIKNPRKDTVSREVLRHPEFQDLVQLTRIRDHFICEYSSHVGSLSTSLRLVADRVIIKPQSVNVESAGQYPPEDLVPEAIKILLEKVAAVEQGLDKLFAADGASA